MNELDNEIARLFAEDDPIADADAGGVFATAVREHVARLRRYRRAGGIGVIATLSASALALASFAPGALAYAPLAVEYLTASPLIAVLACAVMVWWNRSEEA